MLRSFHSLRTKLIVSTLAFLLLLATAVALLIAYGFQETQRHAAEQSVDGLQEEGRETLHMLISREGELTSEYLQQPARASRIAAEHLGAVAQIAPDAIEEIEVGITLHPEGYTSDTRPDRLNDMFIPNFISADDPDVQEQIYRSAFLDTLAPTLLRETPQAVGMYYVGNQVVSRYYPAGAFEGLVPPDIDLRLEPWYAPTAPEQNPERKTTWSSLYPDDVGNGLMVTTCTPVYYDDTFDGMTCLDVTLVEIAEHLERLKLTENSYAFLTDEAGRLIAGPPAAIKALTGYESIPVPEDNDTIGLTLTIPEVRGIVENGLDGIRTVEVDGEPRFLATTTLPDIGWHLGLLAPIAEVTEQSNAVVAAIEQGTAQTIQTSILVMIAFFTAAIGGAIFFSIYLTRPISEMVSATQAVGQGDLSRTIQVSSRDELGTLASSFNQMTRELETAHKELEKSHETLEQTVAERTEALRRESEESARLKDEVMQQAKAMLDMSTPLIPVSDDVIVMPIVGSLSTDRSQQVLETLLQGVSAHRSRIVIIDITGILVVDTAVAQTLIEATQAVRLLGTHVILTGIRPDVAQTLVQLGIDLGAIITCNTLQSGIERARQMTRASMSMN